MDCAVTEQCGAANFKTEFTVSVEFWAANKFHQIPVVVKIIDRLFAV